MNAFTGMRISASGLAAEKLRLNIVSNNIANADTTRSENGGPYIRKIGVFEENFDKEKGMLGIKIVEIKEDPSLLPRVYDPTHPDADENGYVTKPNVNILNEMADLIAISRSYEANIDSINAQKDLLSKTLEIGR